MPGSPKGSSRTSPGAGAGATAFDRAAGVALAWAEDLGGLRRADPASLQREARARLDRFADDLLRSGQPRPAIAPARLALGLVIDQAAQGNPAIPRGAWGAGAHRLLFEGEPMSAARLREFVTRAEAAGPAYAEAARFLAACLARIEAARPRAGGPAADGWWRTLASGALGFCLLVLGWVAHDEWAFHREAARAFEAEALAIGLDREGAIADLADRLDRMEAAARGLDGLLGTSPTRGLARLGGFDAGDGARALQAEAVARHLPRALAAAVGEALASEGEGAALYDTLRAWDVLTGAAAWNPGYLQGWLGARGGMLPDLQGLGAHVPLLAPPADLGPRWDLPQPDPELLAQARVFAAEATEGERAWIELIRSPAMTGLAPWRPTEAVPGLGEVAQRRSGLDVATPIPGAFTAAGWDLAREREAAVAVAAARAEAARMFGTAPPTRADAADLVLARLQAETLAAWSDVLADLRIHPLGGAEAGVLVTGLLAQRRSPLDRLLLAAWTEVGGADRTRPHALQLRIAAEFGPMIRYVESGGLDEIRALFAALNAALGAREADEARAERLMSVRTRLASVAALRLAPLVVVRIVEDVLAQTAEGGTASDRLDGLSNPLTARWQGDVLDLCRRATEGRFPFDPEGADADLGDVAALLAPGGAIDRFVRASAQPHLDTDASPWRWRPEARFEGLSPDSAAFLQRALAAGAGLFDPEGRPGTDVTLAALAERGRATISLGGASAAVDAAGGEARLAWPGPSPAEGATVSFGSGGPEATVARPGPWGLLRLFGALRLRERDDGRRFLVDLRLPAGRIFLEVGFPSPDNPLSRLDLLRGLACPAAL